MNRLSFRQEDEKQVIHRLRSLQTVHDKMLDQMFDELTKRFHNREISDRFWDAVPSDLKGKYKEPISNLRSKIRDIISLYPQYYGNYKNQNKPYFQKVDRQQRQKEELLKSMEEEPLEQQMVGA
jgi:hypothetical protein